MLQLSYQLFLPLFTVDQFFVLADDSETLVKLLSAVLLAHVLCEMREVAGVQVDHVVLLLLVHVQVHLVRDLLIVSVFVRGGLAYVVLSK